MTDHLITPLHDLIYQWKSSYLDAKRSLADLLAEAYQTGADQELEACRLWVSEVHSIYDAAELLNQRRPKPPSLKQQALEALQRAEEGWRPIPDDCDTIRRALEALPD